MSYLKNVVDPPAPYSSTDKFECRSEHISFTLAGSSITVLKGGKKCLPFVQQTSVNRVHGRCVSVKVVNININVNVNVSVNTNVDVFVNTNVDVFVNTNVDVWSMSM